MAKFLPYASLTPAFFDALLAAKSVPTGNKVDELVSLSLWGQASDPRDLLISAVWKERPAAGFIPQTPALLQRSQLAVEMVNRNANGEQPVFIGAAPDGNGDVHFLVTFRQGTSYQPPNLLLWDLPDDATFDPLKPGLSTALQQSGFTTSLQWELFKKRAADYRLHWLIPYSIGAGASARVLYAAVFTSQVSSILSPLRAGIAWGKSLALDGPSHDKAFQGMTIATSRPRQVVPLKLSAPIAGVASPSYTSIWYGDMIGGYAAAHGLSLAQVQAYVKVPPDKLQVMQIQGSGPVSKPVFAVMFGNNDVALARKGVVDGLTVTLPGSPGSSGFTKVDARILSWMRNNGIRRAQFALSRDGKLLTSRAYLYAEAGYDGGRMTGHRDVMRLASVSKAITGAAAVSAIEEDSTLSLTDPVGTLAKWGQGSPFAAWKSRTLRQLLRQQSGILPEPNHQTVLDKHNSQTGDNQTLPLIDPNVWDAYLSQASFDNAGFSYSTKSRYTNIAFVAAGEVTKIVGKSDSYVEFVTDRFVVPAAVRLVVGHELLENRKLLLGEPLYHPAIPTPVTSEYYANGQWTGTEYGAYLTRGGVAAGGWASSAADLLRLFSRLEYGSGGLPQLLKAPATFFKDGLLDAPVAVYGSMSVISPGLGWDTFFRLPVGGLPNMVMKNGGMDGTSAFVARRTTDGVMMSVIMNGDFFVASGDAYSFDTDMVSALYGDIPASNNLPTLDLFPYLDPAW